MAITLTKRKVEECDNAEIRVKRHRALGITITAEEIPLLLENAEDNVFVIKRFLLENDGGDPEDYGRLPLYLDRERKSLSVTARLPRLSLSGDTLILFSHWVLPRVESLVVTTTPEGLEVEVAIRYYKKEETGILARLDQ